MRKNILKTLTLFGYIFTTIVSVIMAIRVDGLPYKILLVAAAMVTFVLAISRMVSAKKLENRIKDLEENMITCVECEPGDFSMFDNLAQGDEPINEESKGLKQ